VCSHTTAAILADGDAIQSVGKIGTRRHVETYYGSRSPICHDVPYRQQFIRVTGLNGTDRSTVNTVAIFATAYRGMSVRPGGGDGDLIRLTTWT